MFYWLLLLPLALVCTVVSYILNPLVVLFCDEDGELHGIWKYFQTWDNSCNPSDIVNIYPAWLSEWWLKHYIESEVMPDEYIKYNRSRWITICEDKDFTNIEEVKRYICRVLWLTRNCAYGFMFYPPFGIMSPTYFLVSEGHWTYDMVHGKMFGAFAYKNSDEFFSVWKLHVYFNIYIGWKLTEDEPRQSMYALRPLSFKIEWK